MTYGIDQDALETLGKLHGKLTPCAHLGCMSHVSHPCEGCGRKWGGPRATKEKTMRPNADQEAGKAKAWNKNVPVGAPVLLVDDDGELEETQTRSAAWVAGMALVSVEGRSGGYLLSRIIPKVIAGE